MEKAATLASIEVGDCVRLNSCAQPKMTVFSVKDEIISCEWFSAEDHLCTAEFREVELILFRKRGEMFP